jgi:outer membrane protein assembly factor BamB
MNSMKLFFVSAVMLSGLALSRGAASQDWPGWRGPTRDGHAPAGQEPPVKWSETEQVVWRAEVRGKGHGSPTVAGDRVYLATADAETQEQLVLAFDRKTGRRVWETVVHRGKLDTGGHRNTSQASSTVAWDGERLYINFLNDKGVHTTALDQAGKIVWQTRVSDYVTHQGFGASPVVAGAVVLVAADSRGGGKLAGLDRRTGKIAWSQERPPIANYGSPAVITAAGRTQAVLSGCNLVASFDPATGRKLWEIEGSTEETVTTPVTDGQRVFVTGGFPRNHLAAVEADGSGRIAWQNGTRVYVPCLLVRDGHLYGILDSGAAVCWKADTGEELWREKVDRDFYGSPVMVGGRIYVTILRGVTSVVEVSPKGMTLLAQNQLGDESLSTPAICDGQIFLRHAKKGAPRQEFLWCVGAGRG